MSPRVSGAVVGLLQRGSPIVEAAGTDSVPAMSGTVTEISDRWGMQAAFGWPSGASRVVYDVPFDGVMLDLTNRTGLNHAAEWVANHYAIPLGPTAPEWTLVDDPDMVHPYWRIGPEAGGICFYGVEPKWFKQVRAVHVPGLATTNPAEAMALTINHIANLTTPATK